MSKQMVIQEFKMKISLSSKVIQCAFRICHILKQFLICNVTMNYACFKKIILSPFIIHKCQFNVQIWQCRVLFIFLCHSLLFERTSTPFSISLSKPTCSFTYPQRKIYKIKIDNLSVSSHQKSRPRRATHLNTTFMLD